MRLLIYYLLFVSSTIFAQDSLRFVPVRAYILSKMIDEVKLGRSCDSTLNATIKAWHSTENSLTSQTEVLKELETSRNLWRERSEAQTLLLQNTDKQHEIDLKLGKRKARKVGFIGGISVLVVVETVRFFIKR